MLLFINSAPHTHTEDSRKEGAQLYEQLRDTPKSGELKSKLEEMHWTRLAKFASVAVLLTSTIYHSRCDSVQQ